MRIFSKSIAPAPSGDRPARQNTSPHPRARRLVCPSPPSTPGNDRGRALTRPTTVPAPPPPRISVAQLKEGAAHRPVVVAPFILRSGDDWMEHLPLVLAARISALANAYLPFFGAKSPAVHGWDG